MPDPKPMPVDPTGKKLAKPTLGGTSKAPFAAAPVKPVHHEQPHDEEEVAAAMAIVEADLRHQQQHGTMGARAAKYGIGGVMGFNPLDLLPFILALIEFWKKIRSGAGAEEAAEKEEAASKEGVSGMTEGE